MRKIFLILIFTILVAGTSFASTVDLYKSFALQEPFAMFIIGLGMISIANLVRSNFQPKPQKVIAKRKY